MDNDVATLSQCLQWLVLNIHQYRICILCKPGLELFTAVWLSSCNHKENKDREIRGLNINTKHKCQHYQYNNGSASMYIHMWYISINNQRCTPEIAQGINHTRMASHIGAFYTRHREILAHQTWVWHDGSCSHKRQANNNTTSIADTDIEPTAQQPHDNWKDRISCVLIYILGNMNADIRNTGNTVQLVKNTRIHSHRKKNTLNYTSQIVGGSWHRYFYD